MEFPIPAVDFATGSEGWHTFTRDKVIENCRKQMNGIHDWDTLVEEQIRKGERLELCWRSGSKLDWVWLEHDEEGRNRPWAVLWGVASVHVSATFCYHEGDSLISILLAPCAIRLGAADRRTLAYEVFPA